MKNILPFPVKLAAVTESMATIQQFFKDSYKEQKEWLADSIAFIKDLSQMDEDFRRELNSKNEYLICLEGEMVSEKDLISRPMEENY